ncbi:recombinase family protein [Duganella dendranthematis]|uniref:Recombinase family protein n=1 Tax=Duganella dendranthematis TaxID=2728021 RepID=A0ABX6M6H0_9BURK|nr:recombinase family protein [Duganella dendranthematis]QJD89909.1 recombinase family protein [Duganella dendranthematis]
MLTMTKAYSYSRFSSDAQRHGTSIDRQQTLARKWCADNNVELSNDVFADEAVSGFHGDNLASGALSRFISHVERGDIERGSYLILENLDRLTRMNAWDASGLLQRLVKHLGIVVVTLRPHEMRFDHNSSALDLLQAILHMDNAHRESARKSDLGKLEWAKRFAAARESGKDIGKRVSNWLTLGEDGKYHLNENADAVRRIFELCIEGYGSTAISQRINAEGYRTFNRGARWGTSAVLTVLTNRAAIGELTPKDGGEPIPNYFPPVIDEDTFNAAQASVNARKVGKVTKQTAEVNVWSKLVFCGVCGSAMHIIQRSKFRYLMCANRRYGECKGSRNVRLDESEDILMAALLELDAMGLVKPDPDKLARELAVADGRLMAEKGKLVVWAEKLGQHPESDTFQRFVLQSEGRIRELQQEVGRLTAELAGGDRLDWSQFKAKLDLTDKVTRKRTNAYLQRLGVKVDIADGYLLTQHGEAKAMLVVDKNKIGALRLGGDEGEVGVISDVETANALAANVKHLLQRPGGGFVYRGSLTVPNGRGTRRTKFQSPVEAQTA